MGGDGWPQTYDWVDPEPRISTDLAYRLIEVNLDGQEHALAVTRVSVGVTASIALTAQGVSLNVCGRPHSRVTLETATTVGGPWARLRTRTLDDAGTETVNLSQERQEAVRFYRVLSD
jgi:hypothetical protein